MKIFKFPVVVLLIASGMASCIMEHTQIRFEGDFCISSDTWQRQYAVGPTLLRNIVSNLAYLTFCSLKGQRFSDLPIFSLLALMILFSMS
jgi:hypothetical protein